MDKSPQRPPFLLFLFSLILLFHLSAADVGTAAFYTPPYLPTACYGNDPSQFPANNLFAAAGEGIWDNAASCGRQYLVRCLSSAIPRACVPGKTIQVKIIDRASTTVSQPSKSGTTFVLSVAAFRSITSSSGSDINIEFKQI